MAAALNASAWLVVREEHPGEGRHAAALQLIELALEAAPERGELLNTLGVALYRNGDLARALEVLQASDRANRRSFAAGHPADAVFLALCHLGRGDAAQARAAGERARRLLAAEPFASDPECRAFLAEMERRFAALDPD
ncbi:MAG: tetratricopeptide repeat protein [Planctomycetes bacterium]|nr:tetratricopeptide repeat protein [Planctomycetota bacterium]